jgi:hypothetical protein
MNTQVQNKKRMVRNLAIFTVATIACGWLGLVVDSDLFYKDGQFVV